MPIHFFYGNEDFLIEKEINKLKQEILKGDVNELNYRVVDNPSFSLFSELIRTNAMMFGEIIILIKCSKYFLESKSKVTLDDKQTKELIEAFNNVSDRVHLILLCSTPKNEVKKPDSRKKLYKELIKITSPQEFQQYRAYEEYKIIPIIKKLAKELDIIINDKECSLLIQTIGASLRDIYMQLEKLKLFAYPEKQITSKMVKEIVSANSDVFQLLDLILAKKYTESLNLISDLLQKEHYLPILALLQTNLSNLVKMKIYSSSMGSFDLMTKLKMKSEYVVKLNLEKIANIPLEELIRLKLNLSKAEYNLKTGIITDPICAFEMMLLEGINK